MRGENEASEGFAMEPLQEQAQEVGEAGDLPAALELWKSLAEKDGEARSFLKYGTVAIELERWEEAEQAFTQAVDRAPASAFIKEAMGALWTYRTDKDRNESLQTAKRWFLEALKIKRNARRLTFLGATYRALEDNASAREAFEEAIQLDPDYEEALYNLAMLEKESAPQRSRNLLERAVQIDPEYFIAHLVLGRVCQRMKDLARAEHHFRRCIEIDPTDYWSNLFLANLLGVLKRNAEAEQTYKHAIKLRPDLVGGSEFFARFLESMGKNAEAASVRAEANLSDRYAAGV
jgi:tetratricopeptide (TPR) repeat protein